MCECVLFMVGFAALIVLFFLTLWFNWGMEAVILWIITILIILIGLAGTIIPALPGTPIIFVGIFIYSFFTGFAKVGIIALIILGVIAVLAQVFDYLAGAYGAKKMGSTKYGVWGSIILGIVGMILGNIIGLVIGIFLGAVIFEMLFASKSVNHSLKVGVGSVLGFLGGTAAKVIFGIAMIIIFFWSVFV